MRKNESTPPRWCGSGVGDLLVLVDSTPTDSTATTARKRLAVDVYVAAFEVAAASGMHIDAILASVALLHAARCWDIWS